ncbi:MAG: hypothetical protein ACRDJN_06000, partial [Chloroflexota bacterium]
MSLASELERSGAEAAEIQPAPPSHRRHPLVWRGLLRRRRTWPGERAEVLVRAGDQVNAGDAVARVERTGRATALDVAALLGVTPDRVAGSLLPQAGDMLADGDVLAERRSMAGLQRRILRSPVSGRLSYISPDHGTLFVEPLPAEAHVSAHLSGTILIAGPSGVLVEGTALAVTGVAGAGPAATGVLMLAETPAALPPEASGAVVACAFPIDEATVGALTEAGAAAVVAPGIGDDTLQRLGWDDLLWPYPARPDGADRWGTRPTPPLTIVLLAVGPTDAPPTLWEALRPLAGRPASALGAEPGAPPELLVPISERDEPSFVQAGATPHENGTLVPG